MPDTLNPIWSVVEIDFDGNVIGSAVTDLPVPSSYKYGLNDISGSDAGRAEDLVMNKMRKGQSRTIDLEWKQLTINDCSLVMQTFNPEYLLVTFLDAMAGGWITRQFYVGDRSVPLFNMSKGRWESISFTIIQRDADLE